MMKNKIPFSNPLPETNLAINSVIDAGKTVYYALDDVEKENIINKLNGSKFEVGRFKGLGEMPAQDLKNTTMHRKTRTLIRVAISDKKNADNAFEKLMGREAAILLEQYKFTYAPIVWALRKRNIRDCGC